MATKQGFVYINSDPYVYQENAAGTSTAIGVDSADNKFKISALATSGAVPSAFTQFIIDPSSDGNVTLTANGTGEIFINSPAEVAGNIVGDSGLTVASTVTLSVLTTAGLVDTNSSGVLSSFATTNHAVQVGNSSGTVTSLGVGTNGQLLVGATTADPSWVTPTAGAGLAVTTNATTLSYALSVPVSIADGGTNTTTTPGTNAVIYFNGINYVGLTNGTTGQILTATTSSAPSWAAPASSVTTIAGTANEITASASTGSVTLSTPSTFIAPGSVASTTSLTAGSGFTVTAGTITLTPLTTAGIVTTTSGGVISSEAVLPIANGGTNTSSTPPTNGIFYFDGTKYVGLTNGTTGQILTATTSSIPSWAAPASGVSSIAGTANEITASASTGAVTLSTPSTFIAPGSVASTTSLTAGSGFTVTAGTTTITPLNTSGVVVNNASGVIGTTATTNHAVQIGNSSNQLASITVGTDGQVLLGATTADPAFGTLGNSDSNIVYTTGTNSLSINLATSPSVSGSLTAGTSVTTTNGNVNIGNTSVATTAPFVNFKKSRSGGVITSGDVLGDIDFTGHDGTGYIVSSRILSTNSGTVATNRIASDLEFYTHPDSTTSSTKRVTIDSTGRVLIGSPDSGTTGTLDIGSASGGAVISLGGTRWVTYPTTGCTYVGPTAGLTTQTGLENTGIGDQVLTSLSSGAYNTAVGAFAGIFLGSGSRNCLLGSYHPGGPTYGVGGKLTGSESDNVLINAPGVTGTSNQLTIGSGTGTGSGNLNAAYICGIQGITVTGTAVLVSSSDQLGIAVSSRRFKDNIQDMDDYSSAIYDLRPVTFNYNVGEDHSQQSGLIAEEVADILPNLVVNDKQGLPQTVKYHDLPVLLLNEIQKLSKRIDELEAIAGR